MRSALLLLAATATALLYMMVCGEPQPAYNNAPAALLLPNGTIVMVPDRGKNDATKTSNELYQHDQRANPCLVDANYAEAKQRSQLGKSDDQRTNQPWMQGSTQVGDIGHDSLVSHQQQLTHPFSIGVNGSILQNSVKENINKPCNNHPQNTITNTNQISPEACRQLGNAHTCNPKNAFPDTYEYEPDCDIKNADSLKCDLSSNVNRVNVQVFDIPDGSPCNVCNGEACDNYSHNHGPTKNESLSSRSRTRGKGDFPDETYKAEGNDRRPPQNALVSTDQVSSKAFKRRIYNTAGIPDRVERDFDFRNTKNSISEADNVKCDPSATFNRDDVQFRNLDISARSPCNMHNCYCPSNYYNYHSPAGNEMCWPRPRTPGHDSSSDISLKTEVSNDHITKLTEPMPSKPPWKDCSYKESRFENASTDPLTNPETGCSNSKYNSHRKGNLAGFRLDLLGGRDLIDNVLFKNQKQTFRSDQKHSQNVLQEIGRPEVSNEKNTSIHDRPGSKEFLQNVPSLEYSNNIDNKESYFKGPVDLPCDESETTVLKKNPRCRPIETGFRVVLEEKRDHQLELKEHECYKDVTYQKPKVEKAETDFGGSLGMNIYNTPKHSLRRPMETGFAEDLKETGAYCSWPPSEENRRLLPHAKQNFCNRDQFTHVSNGVSGENYYRTNVNAVEAINAAHKWKGFLRCPVSNPGNGYSALRKNSMTALKGPRLTRSHSNSLYCRDKCINAHGYCENRHRAYEHRTGENCKEGSDCINCNSFNTPAMERICMPHSLTNGNGEWCYHQPEYMQGRPSINMLARTFQHQTHHGIPPKGQFINLPVIEPHLPCNTTRFMKPAAPYGSFKLLPTFLNQYSECQVPKGSHRLRFPSKALAMPPLLNRPTPPTESLVHCTRLPGLTSPIPLPPVTTGYRRNCCFLPCLSLQPQPISFASFVKDKDGFWWLIHLETIL